MMSCSIPISGSGHRIDRPWVVGAKWSFVGLLATAVLQGIVVVISGSVALLADTIRNVGEGVTAIPLEIVFLFARCRPTPGSPLATASRTPRKAGAHELF
jgi:hypothetical protein